MSSSQVFLEIWSLFKDVVSYDDKEQYAEQFINILINYDVDMEEIKSIFSHDEDIINSLKTYGFEEEWPEESYDVDDWDFDEE